MTHPPPPSRTDAPDAARDFPYDATQDLLCWRPAGMALAAAAVALLLVACSDAKPVGYYRDHAKARSERVRLCVGTGSTSQDCLNARQAEFETLGIPAADGRAVRP